MGISLDFTFSKNKRTALHEASLLGHSGMIDLLFDNGASLMAKDIAGRTPEFYARLVSEQNPSKNCEEIENLIRQKRNHLGTLLLRSAYNGDEKRVTELCNRGADVNAKDEENGCSALHFAAQNGHEAVVRLLCDRGAKVNLHNKTGVTPLHYAAQGNREQVVLILFDHGADLHDAFYEISPLEISRFNDNQAIRNSFERESKSKPAPHYKSREFSQ